MHERKNDDEDEEQIPSYDEIINEDEEELEKAEEFERKFNFRFQEPDAEFVRLSSSPSSSSAPIVSSS